MSFFKKNRSDKSRGAANLETGLLVALIALGAAGAVAATGNEVKNLFGQTANQVEDSDGGPAISLSSASGFEGETMSFGVSLDRAHRDGISLSWSVSFGSAAAGDISAAGGSISIPAGATGASIDLMAIDDDIHEGTETFTLNLTSATFGRIVNGSAASQIFDNENFPAVSLSVSQPSGEEDSVNPTFIATIDPASSSQIAIGYRTINGSADDGSDYDGVSGTWTLAPGETTRTQGVNVITDSLIEADRSFTFEVTGIAGTATRGYTILDDDATPLGYGSAHTEEACAAAGGTVLNASGQNICRFGSPSCKSG